MARIENHKYSIEEAFTFEAEVPDIRYTLSALPRLHSRWKHGGISRKKADMKAGIKP